MSQARHDFGGDWTTEKLQIVAKYLRAYTTALKDKPSPQRPFVKAYIDAFAGTGYRRPDSSPDDIPLFTPEDSAEPDALLKGSARLALETTPPFDRYVFIESNDERCAQLAQLKPEFPHLADRIKVVPGDANRVIQDLCNKNWTSHRAVLFLDPYGAQVEWPTIEAVAATKAIDLWLLWPLGIAINRMLTGSGEIPDGWRRRLDVLIGTRGWYDAFYKVERSTDLLGERENVTKATTDSIGNYLNVRLESVFHSVARHPRVLKNSTGSPLYLLCFAAGNPKGAPIALTIAEHLLRQAGS